MVGGTHRVGSRSPDGWSGVGIRSPIGLVVGSCTSHPGVSSSIPKREEPGKTGAPCVKVPGSSRVPGRDGQTHPHRPRLVVSHSTCSPLSSSPPANSFVIGLAVINTHRIPGAPPRDGLGVTYLPSAFSSDAGYADLPLALLGAPVSIGALVKPGSRSLAKQD